MHQVNVRLPENLYDRLGKLAHNTGKTKSFFVKEAVLEYLEDLEDLYLAKQALKEAKVQKRYSAAEVRRALDLDD